MAAIESIALPKEGLVESMRTSEGSQAALALLKSVANIDRLAILCCLIEGEKNVGELEQVLTIRQPSLSQQLSRLRSDQLVSTRRDGKTIYYRITSNEAEQLIALLHGLYCQHP